MESKIVRWTEGIRKLIWLLFLFIIGYLLIASVFSTCYTGTISYITDAGIIENNIEHTFYIRDAWIIHFILFFLFSIFLINRRKTVDTSHLYTKYMWIFACIALVLLYIILAGQFYPVSDQKRVVEIAAEIHQGNFSALEPGNYLFMHPHQKGIVLYFQVLSIIFEDNNYTAFQVMNALWIWISCFLLVKLGRAIWRGQDKKIEMKIAVVCLLFLPYLFYVSFLYGTVIGEMFALVSFYMVLKFKHDQKWRFVIAGSLSMEAAIILKSNFQIFLIAVIIYLFIRCLIVGKSKGTMLWKNIAFILVLVGCVIVGNAGMNRYITSLNHGKEVRGVPMLAYVAMGLQDGKAAPGWYNGYNVGVYRSNNFDYDLAEKEAKEKIAETVSGYSKDIMTSISFYVKKVSSQWNNPTFQSLEVLKGEGKGRTGIRWLLSGYGRTVCTFIMNLFHTWILAGVFILGILHLKKGTWEETLLLLTFIGGFAFHLFWEAKALYTIPYFLLLLPLCAKGYMEWAQLLCAGKREIAIAGWNTKQGRKMKKSIIIGLFVAVFICSLSYTEIFSKTFARNDDTGIFNIYTQNTVNQDEL